MHNGRLYTLIECEINLALEREKCRFGDGKTIYLQHLTAARKNPLSARVTMMQQKRWMYSSYYSKEIIVPHNRFDFLSAQERKEKKHKTIK